MRSSFTLPGETARGEEVYFVSLKSVFNLYSEYRFAEFKLQLIIFNF